MTLVRADDGRRRCAWAATIADYRTYHDDEWGRPVLDDAAIVRHRAKIEATIANARALVAMHAAGESLAELVWAHTGSRRRAPRTLGDVPASTPESIRLSKALRRRGFTYVGPTTVYAAMQAIGVVDDHLAGCHARPACELERRRALSLQRAGGPTPRD